MEIKVLGPEDSDILSTVAHDLFDDPLNPDATAEFLRDPRHHIVVAIDEGVVVGFASAVHYLHPDKPAPELWINEVGVAPTHSRRGIGNAMLQKLLDQARALGCAEAWVLTDRTNQAAMRLYASRGGVEAPGDVVMFEFLSTGTIPNDANLRGAG